MHNNTSLNTLTTIVDERTKDDVPQTQDTPLSVIE
jgi:hypothetical protein